MESSRIPVLVAMTFIACAPAPKPAATSSAASVTSSPAPAATAPAPAPPSVPTAPSEVVESGRAAFDACYAQARTSDPALTRTKVEITFAVNADGRPQTVDLKYRNRFDDRAKECMRDAALGLHFPPSMQGTQTATIAFAPPGP
jgi:hypothetical protein